MLKRKKKILAILASITAIIGMTLTISITANADNAETETTEGLTQTFFINYTDVARVPALNIHPSLYTIRASAGLQLRWEIAKGFTYIRNGSLDTDTGKITYNNEETWKSENAYADTNLKVSYWRYIKQVGYSTPGYGSGQIGDYTEFILFEYDNMKYKPIKYIEQITTYANNKQTSDIWESLKIGALKPEIVVSVAPKYIILHGYENNEEVLGGVIINGLYDTTDNKNFEMNDMPYYTFEQTYIQYLNVGGTGTYQEGYNAGLNSEEVQNQINRAYQQGQHDFRYGEIYQNELNEKYEQGYNAYKNSQEYNNALYDANQTGYQKGIEYEKKQTTSKIAQARQEGYNEGLAQNNDFTFGALFGSIADTPITIIDSVLNYEFLGVNIKNLLGSVLAIGLAVAVIKFIV